MTDIDVLLEELNNRVRQGVCIGSDEGVIQETIEVIESLREREEELRKENVRLIAVEREYLGDWLTAEVKALEDMEKRVIGSQRKRIVQLEEAANKSLAAMIKVLSDSEPDDPRGPFDDELESACLACNHVLIPEEYRDAPGKSEE